MITFTYFVKKVKKLDPLKKGIHKIFFLQKD